MTTYKFELEVFVDTRPNLRDQTVETDSYLGRRILESIFDHMKNFDDETIVLSYPERWLNILEQRALLHRLEKYGTQLKKVTILTHSLFIIQTTPNTSARVFNEPLPINEANEGKLYSDTKMSFLAPGLNVLGGTITYNK